MSTLSYVRISDSKGSNVSPDRQRAEVADYCTRAGLPPPIEYADMDWSGSDARRTEWQALLAEVRRGAVTHVVTYALDRLFRDEEEAHKFRKLITRKRVTLHVVSSGGVLDLSRPDGVLMFSVSALFAAQLSHVTSHRVKLWAARRKQEGRKAGGLVPYGYTADAEGYLSPHPREQQCIAVMRALRQAGEGYTAIASKLHCLGYTTKQGSQWSAKTILRILEREGVSVAGGEGGESAEDVGILVVKKG